MDYFLELYTLKNKQREDKIFEIINGKKIPNVVRKERLFMYSLRFKDKPVFVAHMDIVGDTTEASQILSPVVTKIVKEKRFLTRQKPEVLGADDLAGVSLLLNNLENINFVFTQFEETGMAGASNVFSNVDFLALANELNVTGFIEFDRRDVNNIIGNVHGYCCKNFSDDIIEHAKKHDIFLTDVMGGATDIGHICDTYPAANLSVGYYNAHGSTEFLSLDHLDKCNELLKTLNDNITEATKYKPGRKTSYYTPSYGSHASYSSRAYGNSFYDDYDDGYGSYYNKSNTKSEKKERKSFKTFNKKQPKPILGFKIIP